MSFCLAREQSFGSCKRLEISIRENVMAQNDKYQLMEKAIEYLASHSNVSLEQLALHLDISAGHCQKLFTRYVGISPKRFQQSIAVNQAKQRLLKSQSVLDASLNSGVSGPGRLHDHFVTLEAMTPGDYKNGGANLTLQYGTGQSPFGQVFIAASERGICKLSFVEEQAGLQELQSEWPLARLEKNSSQAQKIIQQVFEKMPLGALEKPLSVLVKGTNFQIQVWRALLKIPQGHLNSYQTIAEQIGKASASRAVGTAIGSNPIAFLIPCHRVIRGTGELGGYRWGLNRKRHILVWEEWLEKP